MQQNISSLGTSSDGVWQGENPLNYSFPLLIVQTTLVLLTSHGLAFLLKPLHQPKVVAEIIVCPQTSSQSVIFTSMFCYHCVFFFRVEFCSDSSALGRNKYFLNLVFPSWSTPILESVASIGLLFFLFLVGLELELSTIRQSGRKAFGIAVAGMSLPFIFGVGLSFFLRKAIKGEDKVGYGQYIMFLGVALSITAFPVLARILAELKLLTTHIGQTAMAAAALNDVAAWILLTLAVALAGNGSSGAHKTPLTSVWVLLCGVAFVACMFILVRPMMTWVVQQSSIEQDYVIKEAFICLTLIGVMLSGFMTDFIGIHAIFGAFIFGIIIPKGGEFGPKLITRIEDFVAGLLLPLYFASNGLRTDIAKIQGIEAWGLLVLIICTACAGKILGTFLTAVLCKIPVRESLALGFLMNSKGLVELIVLNIGRGKKVLNDEMFAILVLMALFTTFLTTPTVMAIYKPLRRLERASPPAEDLEDDLRILACIHGPSNVPSLINLLESIHETNRSPLKLHVMHLVELTDRSSSILMVQRARKNGFPFVSTLCHGDKHDQIASAFEASAQLGRVHHSTAISVLSTMHEDICHVAKDRSVEMIILPFHKQWSGEGDEAVKSISHSWREVNQRVLTTASCSVAVLIDRRFNNPPEQAASPTTAKPKRVAILFIGGPDDHEALKFSRRMTGKQLVQVTLVRFLHGQWDGNRREKELDESALTEFRRSSIRYEEKAGSNVAEEVQRIGQSREHDILIVGKVHHSSCREISGNHTEYEELGAIGSILTSGHQSFFPSILVIQRPNEAAENEAIVPEMI